MPVTIPLNPFYDWIGAQQQHLRSIKEQLHPAVFDIAMRMLPGVAELHATDKPSLVLEEEGGLSFTWYADPDSPLYRMEINLDPPSKPAEQYEQYSPWKTVHPPGVWSAFKGVENV